MLRQALWSAADARESCMPVVHAAAQRLSSDVRARRLGAEDVVLVVRAAWASMDPPVMSTGEYWDRCYHLLLRECLSAYFEDGGPPGA
jgi:hypothetical protein